MMRLQRPYEHAGIDKHALNPVRVNAFATSRLIGKQGSRSIMTRNPRIELPHPLFWGQFILQRSRSGRRPHMISGNLLKPPLQRKTVSLRLRFQRGFEFGRKFEDESHGFTYRERVPIEIRARRRYEAGRMGITGSQSRAQEGLRSATPDEPAEPQGIGFKVTMNADSS